MLSLRSSPMQYMSLYLLKEDVPDAAVVLAQSQSFDLSKANLPNQLLTEHYEEHYISEFNQALGRYKKIVSCLDIQLNRRVEKISHISFEKLQETNTQLGELWNQCTAFEVQQRKLNEQYQMIAHLKAIWNNMATFGTDLSLFEDKLHFLDIRLGSIPSTHIMRLKKSLALEGYYLSVHLQTGENAHIVVAGLQENKDEIQSLLDAASFQKTQIPPELHGQPEKVSLKIKTLESKYRAKQSHFKQNMEIFRFRNHEMILQIGDILALAKPFMLLSQQLQGMGALVNVNGWVLKTQVEQIKHQLHDKLGQKAVITTRDPKPDEYSRTPSQIKHSRWITPFISLIKQYGIPRYNEFDPSWFFSLSYLFMFGIMFGDIGHGLCLLIASAFLYKKWPEVAVFLFPISLSVIFFGYLYGSIFCFEHIIEAVWIAPLSDPILMLEAAFWWGVGFIVLLNLFSISNRLFAQNIRHALLDTQGVSGLLLYLAILWLGYQFMNNDFKNSYWLLPLIPLFLIGFNKWSGSEAAHGERLLVIMIESYELVINYLANTLSFLRLAAFSLNHVALAVTVFTLADMLTGDKYWLAIVLGNAFILIIEGAIVAIQTLRLEYYEGFSRFFYADGYQFNPLNLSPRNLLS